MPLFDQATTVQNSTAHLRYARGTEPLSYSNSSNGRYDIASLISHGVRTPLAEMHEGSLAVNSREGVGSMVVMRIPQAEVS